MVLYILYIVVVDCISTYRFVIIGWGTAALARSLESHVKVDERVAEAAMNAFSNLASTPDGSVNRVNARWLGQGGACVGTLRFLSRTRFGVRSSL